MGKGRNYCWGQQSLAPNGQKMNGVEEGNIAGWPWPHSRCPPFFHISQEAEFP